MLTVNFSTPNASWTYKPAATGARASPTTTAIMKWAGEESPIGQWGEGNWGQLKSCMGISPSLSLPAHCVWFQGPTVLLAITVLLLTLTWGVRASIWVLSNVNEHQYEYVMGSAIPHCRSHRRYIIVSARWHYTIQGHQVAPPHWC